MKVPYCGRDYKLAPGTAMTLDHVLLQEGALPGDDSYPVFQIGSVTGDRDMFASVTPNERREAAGLPCAMAVFVEDGEGTYRTYTLIGGP